MVDLIVKNRVDLRKGGQTVYGVCLFTDIAGYTSVSETLGPRELSELMHRYFEAVFEPIKQNGGLITDLKGDCARSSSVYGCPRRCRRRQPV
jgi:adenylate cyclase